MNKKIAIIQSNYIPWKGYFDIINMVDEFVLLDTVQYTNRGWRNRNLIKTPKGNEWLTIPLHVKGARTKKLQIRDMTVADPKWASKHWGKIAANYKNSPFFHDLKELFRNTYKSISDIHLSSINHTFIKLICKILNIETKITLSHDYHLSSEKNLLLLELCKKAGANTYLSGPAAHNYLDVNLFTENGVEVEWINYDDYPEYHQLYPPFDHKVSIIDLIFNEGYNAKNFMRSFKCQ